MNFPNPGSNHGDEHELTEEGSGENNPDSEVLLLDFTGPDELQSTRDHLHSIIASSWHQIAWRVENVRTTRDVPNIFRICSRYGHERVIQLLATRLNKASIGNVEQCIGSLQTRQAVLKLSRMRKKLVDLDLEIQSGSAEIETCSALLQRMELLTHSQMAEPSEQVSLTRSSLAGHLSHLQDHHSSLIAERDSLRQLSHQCDVYFSQQQFVALCLGGRYELTPHNLANAIAGAPKMGYRQSAIRCEKLPLFINVERPKMEHPDFRDSALKTQKNADRPQYAVLQLIKRLVGHYRDKLAHPRSVQDVVGVASTWIDRLSDDDSLAASYLKRNKSLLMRSVQKVEERKLRRPDMIPYAIARLFSYLASHVSAHDSLVADVNKYLESTGGKARE